MWFFFSPFQKGNQVNYSPYPKKCKSMEKDEEHMHVTLKVWIRLESSIPLPGKKLRLTKIEKHKNKNYKKTKIQNII